MTRPSLHLVDISWEAWREDFRVGMIIGNMAMIYEQWEHTNDSERLRAFVYYQAWAIGEASRDLKR